MKTKEADGADEKMLPAGEKYLAGDVRASDVKFTTEEKERLNGDAKIDIGTWGVVAERWLMFYYFSL